MKLFLDRHFTAIERAASMAGMFGLGGLILPAYLSDGNRALVGGGLVFAMAFAKLYLSGWFKYQKLGNSPSNTAGSAATGD